MLSLNNLVSDDELEFQDRLVGSIPALDASLLTQEILDKVEQVLGKLTPRQREVLSRRCGISPYTEEETLESIGVSFDITRERVRQIEAQVLNIMSANGTKEEVGRVLFG